MLRIRAEQLHALHEPRDAAFVEKLGARLQQAHAMVVVRRAEGTTPLAELPPPTVHSLVCHGLRRARDLRIASSASLSAYVVLMFVGAPNFDEHPAARAWLTNATLSPDQRVRELVQRLSPRDWREIRRSYRPEAWSS